MRLNRIGQVLYTFPSQKLLKIKYLFSVHQNQNQLNQEFNYYQSESMTKLEIQNPNRKFHYEFFEANRYKISQEKPYQGICNNGFIKLYTMPARVYWHAQNQFEHRVPDWKFHVSVQHQDLKKAWNILVDLFIRLKCRAGMKVIYLRQTEKPATGRQITIYLVKIPPEFKRSSFAEEFGVSISDEHSQDFWIYFMKQNNIKSNGLAVGDLPIGKYVSLRNEAFVSSNSGSYIYPPDQQGWNPLKQQIPINIQKMRKSLLEDQEESKNNKWIFYVSIPILLSMIAITGFILRR